MSSRVDSETFAVDPENRLLARSNRRRLEAEAIRDAILAVSGRLNARQGGSILTVKNRTYPVDPQSFQTLVSYESRRRSIYLPVLRNTGHDMFRLFDFPDPSVVNGRREATTIASQALFLLNSPFVLDCAEYMARRLLGRMELDDAARVAAVYGAAFGRPPAPDEMTTTMAFLAQSERTGVDGGRDRPAARLRAWQGFCQMVMASNEFLYVE